MPAERVGIRQFRENLSDYLESDAPVAITRHGQTVGVYVPAKRTVSEADIQAFREAHEQLQKWMKEEGLDEETLVAEFEELRAAERGRRKHGSHPEPYYG